MVVQTRSASSIRREKRQAKKRREQEAARLEASSSHSISGVVADDNPPPPLIVDPTIVRSRDDHRPPAGDINREPPRTVIPDLTFGSSSLSAVDSSLMPTTEELAFHHALGNQHHELGPRELSRMEPKTPASEPRNDSGGEDTLPTRKKSPRPTVEEVEDEEDTAHKTNTARLSTILESPTESINTAPHRVPLPASSAEASNGTAAQYYRLITRQKRARRRGKARASEHSTSRHGDRRSEKAGSTTTFSPEREEVDDDDRRPNGWDESTRKAAEDAISREREMFANPELYRQRRESYLAQERRMREIRVLDDHRFAADLLAQEIEAEHDHLLAKKLAQEEQQLRELALSVQRSAKAAADQEARTRKLEDAARLQRESSERTKRVLAAEQLREREAASAIAAVQAQRRATTAGGRTPSRISVASSVHKESANNADPVVSGTTRVTHTFRDRVILQRMRLQDLMKAGKSATLDQGISWDKDGNPFEVGPAPSRGSSVGTRGGRVKRSPGAADTKDSRGSHPASTCGQPVDIGNNGVQYPGDITGKGFADAAAESSNRKDGNSPMPERKANEPLVPPKKDDRSGYFQQGNGNPRGISRGAGPRRGRGHNAYPQALRSQPNGIPGNSSHQLSVNAAPSAPPSSASFNPSAFAVMPNHPSQPQLVYSHQVHPQSFFHANPAIPQQAVFTTIPPNSTPTSWNFPAYPSGAPQGLHASMHAPYYVPTQSSNRPASISAADTSGSQSYYIQDATMTNATPEAAFDVSDLNVALGGDMSQYTPGHMLA
ncbi:hypothetical protein C8R44DRAFT_753218 [Mycena epipterygia]|nr:hypothetical protein C8R44DRAFT_753218 [Mycena epipterygia]